MPEPSVNPDDKMQAQLLAGSLRAFAELMRLTPWLLALSVGLTLVQPQLITKGILIVQMLATVGQSYLAWRLRWDAELFQTLADGRADEVALDRVLSGFRKQVAAPRPFESRVAGAQRLMWQFLQATFVLWVCSVATVILSS